MNKTPAVLVFVVALLMGCGSADASPGDEQRRLYVFGDSYTAATYGGWAAAAAYATGRQFVTYGQSGTEMRQVLARVEAAPRPDGDDMVVIYAGLNDLRHYGTDPQHLAEYRADLASAVRDLSGAQRVVVVEPLPILAWDQYAPWDKGSDAAVGLYRQAVEGTTAWHLLPLWHPATDIGPDGVHPNAAGESVLSAAAIRVLAARPPRWLRH